MTSRKQSATVQLKLRFKEPLRARIEKAAQKRGSSMNSEIVDRLDKSFAKDETDQLAHKIVMEGVCEQFGGAGIYSLMRHLADAIPLIEAETEKSWRADEETFCQINVAFKAILRKFGPGQNQPTKSTIDPFQLGEDVAGVLVGKYQGSRTEALLKEGDNPKTDPKVFKD